MSEEPSAIREVTKAWSYAEESWNARAFADNFSRLLGLHRLTAAEASELLGISAATLSAWLNAHREPRLSSLSGVAQFFEVNLQQLAYLPAPTFMERDLGDAERFRRVEEKIRPDAYRRQSAVAEQ